MPKPKPESSATTDSNLPKTSSHKDKILARAAKAIERSHKHKAKSQTPLISADATSTKLGKRSRDGTPRESVDHSALTSGSHSQADDASHEPATAGRAAHAEPPAALGSLVLRLADEMKRVQDASTAVQKQQASVAATADHVSAIASTMARATQVSTGQAQSVKAAGESWGLHPALLRNVMSMGFQSWFPVQADAVPLLVRADAACDPTVGDLCLAAPTGSGKTLAYALPLVQAALRAPMCRLTGVVIVPTRDLAEQVTGVLEALCVDTHVRVAAITGAATLATEQRMLCPAGVSDTVHIVVATPGRLLDHLDAALPIDFSHCRYIVLDEADRLLGRQFLVTDWLRRLYQAACPGGASADEAGPTRQQQEHMTGDAFMAAALQSAVALRRIGEGALPTGGGHLQPASDRAVARSLPPSSFMGTPVGAGPLQLWAGHAAGRSEAAYAAPLRRIVCSATFTGEPAQVAALALRHPIFMSSTQDVAQLHSGDAAPAAATAAAGVDGKYTLPSTLSEAMMVIRGKDKPGALLLTLEHCCKLAGCALVFASTTAMVHRLARMVQLWGVAGGGEYVAEFSAQLKQSARRALLARVAAGEIRVLVASDAAARGLDLSTVSSVIQYDPPLNIEAYVHRVGRTARAGQVGCSYTLLTSMCLRNAGVASHYASRTHTHTLTLCSLCATQISKSSTSGICSVTIVLTVAVVLLEKASKLQSSSHWRPGSPQYWLQCLRHWNWKHLATSPHSSRCLPWPPRWPHYQASLQLRHAKVQSERTAAHVGRTLEYMGHLHQLVSSQSKARAWPSSPGPFGSHVPARSKLATSRQCHI